MYRMPNPNHTKSQNNHIISNPSKYKVYCIVNYLMPLIVLSLRGCTWRDTNTTNTRIISRYPYYERYGLLHSSTSTSTNNKMRWCNGLSHMLSNNLHINGKTHWAKRGNYWFHFLRENVTNVQNIVQ